MDCLRRQPPRLHRPRPLSPEDIQAVLFDVLRHRIILSFEAEAAGIDQDRVVQRILDVVAVA